MKSITYFLIMTMLLFGVQACSSSSELFKKTLDKSGKNRKQLENVYQQLNKEQKKGFEFLLFNMPQHDLNSLSEEFLINNITLAYKVMDEVEWGKNVPEDIFINYILPYANLNERRDAWRPEFYNKFLRIAKQHKNSSEAANDLNHKIFKELKVIYSTQRSKPDQSPFESIQEGKASCTGLSILLVNACRSVGIPARIVGTPLWHNKRGNHNWVEIWDKGWHYMGAAEPADTLNKAWFTSKASKAIKDSKQQAIYAATFKKTDINFPLVWNDTIKYVSAINVTDRYTKHKNEDDKNKLHLSLRVWDKKNGRRIKAQVQVLDNQTNKEIFTGTSNGPQDDMNHVLKITLSPKKEYRLVLRYNDTIFYNKKLKTSDFSTTVKEIYVSNNMK